MSAFGQLSNKPPNGTRFSRREASAASEAVGWKRSLGALLRISILY
jgi:hypothetical protein